MTSRNGYFPGKTKAKRSAIITPRTAQETQIAAMPRQSRAARQALAKTPPLRVGGDGLVEGADRIMRTPTEHQCRFQKATAPVHWVGRTECIGLLTRPVQ